MIHFILNNQEVSTDLPPGTLVLDYVRYHKHLMGTKIGCREGDCGACTVLVGELLDDELIYKSATSCLMAIGNAHHKQIVTVEGLNMDDLNPVQQAMSDEAATQCGFCTPGFVVSLAGFCLSKSEPTYDAAIAAINGNICRCTGYKSIEKAAARVSHLMQERKGQEPVSFVIENKVLPHYFKNIKERLKNLSLKSNGILKSETVSAKFLGGGTDLYVQQHEKMVEADIAFMFYNKNLKGIRQEGSRCVIGASATVTDILESPVFQHHFPDLNRFIKLVSSTPIRNIATVAGNFINASPIGDLTIFFLALDAQLVLSDGEKRRRLPLRNLYLGYKKLDKKPEEFVETISFELPVRGSKFNFEKVSKRTHLDIASVNTAISISVVDDVITSAALSAGGVGPVPMYLKKTSEYLTGKILREEIVEQAIDIAQLEIAPISDARGSKEYKRLLLTQLIKVHFMTLYPLAAGPLWFNKT